MSTPYCNFTVIFDRNGCGYLFQKPSVEYTER